MAWVPFIVTAAIALRQRVQWASEEQEQRHADHHRGRSDHGGR